MYCLGLGIVILGAVTALYFVWFPPMSKVDLNHPSLSTPTATTTRPRPPVEYDSSLLDVVWDPFNLTVKNRGSPFIPPSLPGDKTGGGGATGYLREPDLVGDALVFVSEGDLYYTRLGTSPMTAMKLTTTVGNVLSPKINPKFPNLIAYTATYQGNRDIYVIDLAQNAPAQRLTFWETGVYDIAGWGADGTTLVFASTSIEVSLPDIRLYEMTLVQGRDSQKAVLQIEPIPLSQALNAAFHEECIFFTRFRQTSNTVRYVGGTAESLWAYCNGQELAVPITSNYNGTSKEPSIIQDGEKNLFLLFLSDRSIKENSDGSWTPTSMNLWAMPLPSEEDLYQEGGPRLAKPIPLTSVSCQFGGKSVREFAADTSGSVILRIGADLHYLSSAQILDRFSHKKKPLAVPEVLPIRVASDFHEQQERLIPVNLLKHLTDVDVFDTSFGTTSAVMTLRGQAWVAPVLSEKTPPHYQGAGQNIPARRYRVAPGAQLGGMLRILKTVHIPSVNADEESRKERLALVLATDPLSSTAEHAFYLLPLQQSDGTIITSFTDPDRLPTPFLGGHVNGGSTRDGGLGSVRNVVVSPCGRRMAWTDKDGRICVMNIPIGEVKSRQDYQVLPADNELGEPLNGNVADLRFSPGGRYLAINHSARNQFAIISIIDCGDPGRDRDNVTDVVIGRAVQATPSRFNSVGAYWGKTTSDIFVHRYLTTISASLHVPPPDDVATTLYFLTDRDIVSDVYSPWGSRVPMPHFEKRSSVYALPLVPTSTDHSPLLGRFPGEGAMELFSDEFDKLEKKLLEIAIPVIEVENRMRESSDQINRALRDRRLSRNTFETLERYLEASNVSKAEKAIKVDIDDTPAINNTQALPAALIDMEIDFGERGLHFARTAYRIPNIPEANYVAIVTQTSDDGSFVLANAVQMSLYVKLFSAGAFPSDKITEVPLTSQLFMCGESTNRKYIYLLVAEKTNNFSLRVISNTAVSLAMFIADATGSFGKNFVDTDNLALSVWPVLEYQQLFGDAWRMLRDYFYDVDMHKVNWPEVYERYQGLVKRCGKREELDDVLAQMAAELSALHVFVYGGEYNLPFNGDANILAMLQPASLGATLRRSPDWKGYMVTEIPLRDPDFNLMDGTPMYSPLSDQALRPSGQRGLAAGDVIVGINGESVMNVPDIHNLLRGMAGRSVRLDILRLASTSTAPDANSTSKAVTPEVIVTVPITAASAANLRYTAWESRTREKAQELAKQAGFSVGYLHMRAMGRDDEDAFARGVFPDYDKDGLIIDVRGNHGGNIDSWIISFLQRRAWMYWGDRVGVRKGDLDWNMQYAFRGHVVVLIDEHTSSDGEGVSRGISELGLGRLIGTRTWGGGIWLSSDNILVDGGIASAPEIGIFNSKFGWGGGIEQQGVTPDIEVDNNPRTSYDGRDLVLERAIKELKLWLAQEPIAEPKEPGPKPNMSLKENDCKA
jgi:C-terminal processing protease CtpA/Prc